MKEQIKDIIISDLIALIVVVLDLGGARAARTCGFNASD
jgi:hypothetical protein